jgi:hypothetical protein
MARKWRSASSLPFMGRVARSAGWGSDATPLAQRAPPVCSPTLASTLPMKGREGIRGIVLVLALPVLTGAAAPAPAIVQIGAAYTAKQMCSCLFVVGRPEASCRAEFKPDIDAFAVAIDRAGLPARAQVSATVGPVAGEATFSRGYGCVVAR